MTIPEAKERLEHLALQLNNCHEPTRRQKIETRISRCRRSIQITRQKSRDALAGLAALLPVGPDQDLIRRATTEQLAVALAQAVQDQNLQETVRKMADYLRTSRA